MRPHGKDMIEVLHSSSADTGFDLVTQLPIPLTTPEEFLISTVPPAFFADGLKFAVVAHDDTVSVLDVRNKIPLMVKEPHHFVHSLRFSSGILGRAVLAFTTVSQLCLDVIFFMLNESAQAF